MNARDDTVTVLFLLHCGRSTKVAVEWPFWLPIQAGHLATLRGRAKGTECLGLSVACERDDGCEAVLLRVAGDGQATMEETAEPMRSREMSARRYGDFIVGAAAKRGCRR